MSAVRNDVAEGSPFGVGPAIAGRRDPVSPPTIAVLVPCYNEETTIGEVVESFRTALPGATVYVYDNNSTDQTAARALSAGAIVRQEHRQGKGYVVRRMFSDVDADVYFLVDGDGTYDATIAPIMLQRLMKGRFDVVNCVREHTTTAAYRPGHVFGNRLLTALVRTCFGARSQDMLSGYKAMSRRFVKTFPSRSSGFEIETEILVHSLQLDVPYDEVRGAYRERPPGSQSKLSTIRDGIRIVALILHLIRDEKPLEFFTGVGLLFLIMSSILATPVLLQYVETGLVPRLPTLVVSVGAFGIATLAIFAGLVLDSVARGRREQKLLSYLSCNWRPPD